jgi:hypothetical protein
MKVKVGSDQGGATFINCELVILLPGFQDLTCDHQIWKFSVRRSNGNAGMHV